MNKTKKRICLLLTIVMILSLALPALAAPKIDKKVSLKKNKIITVYAVKGQTVQLKAAAGLKWTSSKKSVATVKKSGKNGIVTTKKKGTTTIQGVKGKTKYRCKFVVETPKINKASASISVGGSTTLKISGTKQKPKWSSSNEGVAIVSSSGVVHGIGQGTANIVANVGGAKYSCSVTVNQGVPTPAPGPMITATPIPTPIPTATPTPTPIPTATATPIPTATATPIPTATATPIPTATPTPTPPPQLNLILPTNNPVVTNSVADITKVSIKSSEYTVIGQYRVYLTFEGDAKQNQYMVVNVQFFDESGTTMVDSKTFVLGKFVSGTHFSQTESFFIDPGTYIINVTAS